MSVLGLSVDSCIQLKYGESLDKIEDKSLRDSLLESLKESASGFIQSKIDMAEDLYSTISSSLSSLVTAGTSAAGTLAAMTTLVPSGPAAAVAVAVSTKSGLQATLDSIQGYLTTLEEILTFLGATNEPVVKASIEVLNVAITTTTSVLSVIPVS